MRHPVDIEALRPKLDRWQTLEANLVYQPDAVWLGAFGRVETDRHRLRCIVSVDLADEYGAGNWLHLSVSRANRLPTWADLCKARDELGYGDRLFVQLMPPTNRWLNIHDNCLHLLHRLDAETFPKLLWDFGKTVGMPQNPEGSRRA